MFDNTANWLYQSHVTGTNCLDTTAPTVSLNLVDGSTYSGAVTITASAGDEGFGVSSLQLYIDGVLTHTEYDSSLTYNWKTGSFKDGQHTIRIRAEDAAGHISNAAVDVAVSNLPGKLVPIVAAIIIICVVGGSAFIMIGKTEKSNEGQKFYPAEGPGIGSQYSAQDYVVQPPVKDLLAFCPSCGAARNPPNARFCGKCGSAFPD